MIDREKVLKGLRCCAESDVTRTCPHDCPYEDDGDLTCEGVLHRDLLEMLEPVAPVLHSKSRGCNWYRCGNCGYKLPTDFEYCAECGRAVKWR